MKRTIYSLIGLIVLMMITCSTRASHIMGGEITYTWVSGNTYNLSLTLYRDCSGIAAPSSASVVISSASCGVSLTATLTPALPAPIYITPSCPGYVSTCQGGNLPGAEKHIYTGTVTLPSNCPDYIISRRECCRNAAITNLENPGSHNGYFSATLNNLNFPFNSSPTFATNPVIYLEPGNLVTINNGVFDPDGDSIVVSLSPALDDAGTPIPYVAGFSYLNPMNSSSGVNVNPANGDLSVTPTGPEVSVIVYRIEEYRNGQLVGSISRDIQVVVSGTGNQLPTLTGINGSNSFITSVCIGDTLQFNIDAIDADPSDSLHITWSAPSIPNLQVISNGAQQPSASIQFIADTSISGVSAAPYLIHVEVADNHCPINGVQSYVYQVYVNACNADVWPGDANNDLTCDMYDVLPIGLAYGQSGPVRVGASTAWVAQSASNWSQNFISNTNYKYADCNGDGIIDANDTTVIGQNYGLTHPLRLAPPVSAAAVGLIYLESGRDTVNPMDAFPVSVKLGNSTQPVQDIYGIAFRLNFDPALLNPLLSSFSFTNSQLGIPGNDLITFVRQNWSAGFIDAVAVRNNHTNTLSDNVVAQLDVVIIDNVSARTLLRFSISDVRGVSANGMEQYFTTIDDSVSVNITLTNINDPYTTNLPAYIYPNPANSKLHIVTAKESGLVRILDTEGRMVMEANDLPLNKSIDISALPAGIYTVSIITSEGIAHKKLMIQR